MLDEEGEALLHETPVGDWEEGSRVRIVGELSVADKEGVPEESLG